MSIESIELIVHWALLCEFRLYRGLTENEFHRIIELICQRQGSEPVMPF